MPGFTIGGHGAGALGEAPPAGNLELRRAHRWVFKAFAPFEEKTILLVLKSASRPSLNFDEETMHHNQEEVWLAGKHHWDPITLTWYDVEQDPDMSDAVWKWLGGRQAGGGGPFDVLETMKIRKPSEYKLDSVLTMVDSYGAKSEEWKIYHGWPQAVNWNTIDYTTSDVLLIEVTYRFDRAVKQP